MSKIVAQTTIRNQVENTQRKRESSCPRSGGTWQVGRPTVGVDHTDPIGWPTRRVLSLTHAHPTATQTDGPTVPGHWGACANRVANTETLTHAHTYIHTYIHKYIHTYIHTYIHKHHTYDGQHEIHMEMLQCYRTALKTKKKNKRRHNHIAHA